MSRFQCNIGRVCMLANRGFLLGCRGSVAFGFIWGERWVFSVNQWCTLSHVHPTATNVNVCLLPHWLEVQPPLRRSFAFCSTSDHNPLTAAATVHVCHWLDFMPHGLTTESSLELLPDYTNKPPLFKVSSPPPFFFLPSFSDKSNSEILALSVPPLLPRTETGNYEVLAASYQ